MKARVTVTLKSGILDPQGKAIEGALKSLGIAGVALLLGVDAPGGTAALVGGLLVVLATTGYAVGAWFLKRRLPGVQFVTVFFSKKDRSELRDIVRGREWTQPVAVDDGALVNMYGVGGCPTTVFARPGGKVLATKLGNITEADLQSTAERLR